MWVVNSPSDNPLRSQHGRLRHCHHENTCFECLHKSIQSCNVARKMPRIHQDTSGYRIRTRMKWSNVKHSSSQETDVPCFWRSRLTFSGSHCSARPAPFADPTPAKRTSSIDHCMMCLPHLANDLGLVLAPCFDFPSQNESRSFDEAWLLHGLQ